MKKIIGILTLVALLVTSVVLFVSPATLYADGPTAGIWVTINGPTGSPPKWDVDVWAYADGANGLTYDVSLGGHVYSGPIDADEWGNTFNFTGLEAGEVYIAKVVIKDGDDFVDEITMVFSLWEHEQWINVVSEGKKVDIRWHATNSGGREAECWVWKLGGGFYEAFFEDITSDPWMTQKSYNLSPGSYEAGMVIDGYLSLKTFKILADGSLEILEPAKSIRRGPAINEKPLTAYEKTNTGFVTLAYNRLLSRAPEKEGLDAWLERLTIGGLTGADLFNQFIFGEECQKTISGYTNGQFIAFLYKALFSRVPIDEELQAWLDRMSAGMTKEEVVNGFTLSEEFVNLCKEFGIIPYEGYISTEE